MRTKLRSKFTLLLVVCAALLAVPAIAMALTADPSGSTSPAPTIQSDKADYGPGATVTLTGSNWQPGESVNIVVNDDAGQTWSRNVNVTADASGNIKDQFNLPDWFVATYKVTATGAQSGVATTSFTDGSLRGTTNLPNTTPDTTTTVQYSLYDGSGCNGTPTKNGTQTLTESSTPNISSVGANESMKVTAAATASNGWVFDKWTTTDATISFVPAGDTTSRTICVQGFQANQQTIKANYTALAATNDSYSTSEDNALNVAAPGVLANDTGSNLSAVKVTNPTHGSVTLNANGSFTYTPDANYNGPDSFTYKANNGTADSNTATVNITVTAVNDAPKAVNDSYSVNEDGTLNVADGANDVLSNDTDADGDSLTVTNNTSPAHGSVTVNANGSFTYTPNGNYHGPDSFNYTVSDGKGGTSTGTVNITVTAVNDKPTAENQSVTTDEDNAKEITLTGNDVDGDSLTYEIVSGPQNGELTGDGATRTYTPDANYHGPDSFTYKVNDGTVDSETATVNITVTPVNDAPDAVNDTATTDEDTSALIDVKANDTDVDGDTLTITNVTNPAHGTAVVEDGKVKYTPAANYNGSDSFTYTVSDGNGGTDTATVNLTVTAVNDGSTVTLSGAALANEGETQTYTFTVNDPDSGDTFTVKSGFPDCGTGGNLVAGSLTTTASGGSFKCTFPDGPANPTVRIQVTDGGSADSNEATKSVTVANVNPTIGTLTTTGSGTACLGSNNVVKLSFSITDPGVDTQSGTINWGDGTTTEFNGSSVTDATHSYSAGTYTITVTAKDSDGGPAVPKSTSGTQNVSLLYNVSELQDPVNRTGMTMSVFKSGSTVPLKVIITDCNNQPVNGLVPRISFNRINPSTPALGVNEALSTQPNDTNFLMRDAGNGQYIYNLNTKTLPDQDATYNANITDSKATQTAPATYAKVTQTFGIRTK